jgi:hypothetical protein
MKALALTAAVLAFIVSACGSVQKCDPEWTDMLWARVGELGHEAARDTATERRIHVLLIEQRAVLDEFKRELATCRTEWQVPR